MSLNETLRLIIMADTRGAVTGFNQVGAAADKNLTKGAEGLDRFGAGLTRAGVGMATTGGLLVVGLGKAAQASEDAHLQLVKLENSMANNPKLAGESSKAFTDLAKSIQGKTAADGDAIIGGQAVLAQMGLEKAQILELTPLVVDLARKKGIDLVSAATIAAKAVGGTAGALTRQGIAVDEAAFKTDAYTATVDALSSSVGGFANEEGETFSGKLASLKNQLGDMVEGVGGGAVDAFSSMFDAMQPVITGFNRLDPAVQGTVGKVATFSATGLIFAGVASTIIGKLITMREQFKAFGSGTKNALGGLTIALGGVALVWQEVAKNQREAREGADEAIGAMKSRYDALPPSIDKLRQVLGGLKGDVQAAKDALASDDKDPLQELLNKGKGFEEGNRKIIESGEAWIAQLEAQETEALALAEAMGITTDEALGLVTSSTAVKDAAAGAEEGFGSAAAAAAGMGEQIRGLDSDLHALYDPIFAASRAQEALAEAQEAVTEAEKEYGQNSVEAQAARANALEATVGMESALLRLNAGVKDGSIDIADYEATLDSWVAQGRITQQTADEAKVKFAEMNAESERANKTVTTTINADTSDADEGIRGVSYDLWNLTHTYWSVPIDVRYRAPGAPPGFNLYGGGYVAPSAGGRSSGSRSVASVGRMSFQQPAAQAQPIIVQIGDEVIARVVANAQAVGARRGIG